MVIFSVIRSAVNFYAVLCTFYQIIKAPKTFFKHSASRSTNDAVSYVIGCSALVGIIFVSVLSKSFSDVLPAIIDYRQFAISGLLNAIIVVLILALCLKIFGANLSFRSIINTSMYLFGTSALILSLSFPFCLRSYLVSKFYNLASSETASYVIIADLFVIIVVMTFAIRASFSMNWIKAIFTSITIIIVPGIIRSVLEFASLYFF